MAAHLRVVPDVVLDSSAAPAAHLERGLDVADVLRLLGQLGQRVGRQEGEAVGGRALQVVR